MLLFSPVYSWQQLKSLNRNFAKGSQCRNRLSHLKVGFHADVFCCLIRTRSLFFTQTGSIHETRQAAGWYTAPDRTYRTAESVRLPSRSDKLAWIFLQHFESRYCKLVLMSWCYSWESRQRKDASRETNNKTGYIMEGRRDTFISPVRHQQHHIWQHQRLVF